MGNSLIESYAPEIRGTGSVVVYSAMYGNYFHQVPPLPHGLEGHFFTDSDLQPRGWITHKQLLPDSLSPRMQAKWFKVFPHLLFPEADVSIWIDAGWKVRRLDGLMDHLDDTGLCFFPHRWHSTLRQELEATLALPKYAGLPVKEQVEHYFASGFQDTEGIVECTSLLRAHHNPNVIRFCELWWEEQLRWTPCDQLSAPYVLWAGKIAHTKFPMTLAEQTWFTLLQWRGDL